ncbi:hypothetical protein [Fusobacterium sp. PH5-44]|uniref:hypothetical protein n=1 Tax=unclassified Fusobacterium TaxID=2648384 RepID=UPI003D1A46A0
MLKVKIKKKKCILIIDNNREFFSFFIFYLILCAVLTLIGRDIELILFFIPFFALPLIYKKIMIWETEVLTLDNGEMKIKLGFSKERFIALAEIKSLEYQPSLHNTTPVIENYIFNLKKYKTVKINLSKSELYIGYKLTKKEYEKMCEIVYKYKNNYEEKIRKKACYKNYEEIFYNSNIEKRYEFFLKKLLEEEKIYCIKSIPMKLWSGTNLIESLEFFENINIEEIEFYRFYTDNLTKKDLKQTEVSIMYNGETEKIVTLEQLKNDINDIRDGISKIDFKSTE